MVTYGSGARTGTVIVISAMIRTTRQVPHRGLSACYVAVSGSAIRLAAVWLIEATSLCPIATASLVSVLCVFHRRMLF